MTAAVVALACIVVMMTLILVGCAPTGFLRANLPGPLIYKGNWDNAVGTLAEQFPSLNTNLPFAPTRMYFLFESEKHFVELERVSYTSIKVFSITVFQGNLKLGKFVEIPERWRTGLRHISAHQIFLHNGYLYYNYTWWQTRFAIASSFSMTFTREEFFRFNLNTGVNTQIRLTQFVKSLQQIDSNWAINPAYRGRR